MDREKVEKWLNDRNLTMAPKEMFTADGLEFLFDTHERQAKAIVALSEALSEYLDSHYPYPAQYALTTHADAIKRARGGE